MNITDSIEVQGGPIALVFSKTGRAFFSERITGNIWEIIGKEDYRLIKHLPVVNATGHHETGVFGIALDSNFESNGNMYAYFTSGDDVKHASNGVMRFSTKNREEKMIISDIPAGTIHNGGVITTGPDGKLYIGTGVNNQEKEKSQDIKYLGGKVLRINTDGSIPADNPYKGSPVYSLGHRNVFGMAFHPRTDKLYISDVGPDNDDEINIIKSGGNYGWPKVVGYSNNPHFIDPIYTFTPVITPTQLVFFKNELYFGSFNEGSIHRLTLTSDGEKIASDKVIYRGKPFGIVGVFVGPEEDFFVATTNSILKINLKKGR
jgi:glucose/arabinose dehydrogenase